MEEGTSYTGNRKSVEHDEVYSKSVRAGKRTYFFDVKATRKNEYYLTITESKKRFNKEGQHYYEKHKIFLYKEDFDKFQEGLSDVLEFIQSSDNLAITEQESFEEVIDNVESKDYINVEFEDLEETVVVEELKEK